MDVAAEKTWRVEDHSGTFVSSFKYVCQVIFYLRKCIIRVFNPPGPLYEVNILDILLSGQVKLPLNRSPEG